MRLKKFTQKDRYGNMLSYEFDVPPMEEIPHPGMPIGTDTVPAWLTPGERVMNAEAERMYGPALEQMNEHGRAIQRAQGGTIPEYAACGSKVKYKAAGGPVYAQEGMSPEQMSALLANQVLAGALDPRTAEAALSNMGMGAGQAQAVIPSFALPTPPPTDYEADATMGVRSYPQVPTSPQTLNTELPPIRPQQQPTPTDYEGDVYSGLRPYPEVPQVPGTLDAEPPLKVEDRDVSTRSLLLKHEDMKNVPYKDSEGHWTVGVGHKITDKATLEKLNKGETINYSDEQVMNLFNSDLQTAKSGAQQNFSGFNSYSPNLQDALISMNFQLGTEGTRKFKDFRAALAKGDYETAKAELDDSDWAKQTPTRVEYLKAVIDQEAAGKVGNKNTITSTSGQPVVDSRFGVESTYNPEQPEQSFFDWLTTPQDKTLGKQLDEKLGIDFGNDGVPNQGMPEPVRFIPSSIVEETQKAGQEAISPVVDVVSKINKQLNGSSPEVDPLAIGMETYAEDDQRLEEQGLPPVPRDVAGQQGIEVPVTEDQKIIDQYREANPYSNKSDEQVLAEAKPDARTQAMSDLVNQNADELEEPLAPPSPKENAANAVIKETEGQESPESNTNVTTKDVETKGNEQSDEAKSKAQAFFEEWGLSDLFDKKEIGRMVALYLGSRALGYSHGGSLNYAAKNYAERVQQKATTEAAQKAKLNEQAFQLAKEGKHSPKAIENYRRTGNLAYLDLGTSQGIGKGEYEEFFREGKKYRAQKIEMPDGSIKYRTDEGLTIDGSFNQDKAFHKGTPEYDKRRETANNNNVAIFEEAFDMAGGKDSDTNEWTQRLKVGPNKAAREFWAWAESARLDPNSNEARTIMNNAYQQAIQDAKDGKIIIPSLEPYLKSQLFREQEIPNPDMFLLNPEEVAEGKQMPKYIRQDKMNDLFDSVYMVAKKQMPNTSLTVAKKKIFDRAIDRWSGNGEGGLTDAERQSWLDSTEKEAGVTGFYLYLQEELQKAYNS